MKVLLCHNHYQQRGGEDQVFDDEAWLLESRGHTVLRFTRHNDQVAELGRWKLAWQTLWNGDIHDELSGLLARERPDVMHCTNTLPLLSPTIYFLTLYSVIGTFKAFNHIFVMSSAAALGTTDTASIVIFQAFRRDTRYGYASALAIVLLIVILAIALYLGR